MYKKETQLAFEDFIFPFGELDSENEWVKPAGLIPWDTVERAYAKQFVDNGHLAHSARIALGCECQRKSEPSANQYLSHLCERILEPPTPKVTANT